MRGRSQQQSPRSMLPPIAWLALSLFLWPALLTFDAGDWPSPNQFPHNDPTNNACGAVGALLAFGFRQFLGLGAYPFVLFATVAGLIRLMRGRIDNFWERLLGLSFVVVCTSASAHLIVPPTSAVLPVGNGGLVGYAVGNLLTENASRLGTIIVLTASFIVGMIFTTQGWILQLPGKMRSGSHVPAAIAGAAGKLLLAVPIAAVATLGSRFGRRDSSVLPTKSKRKRGVPLDEEAADEDECEGEHEEEDEVEDPDPPKEAGKKSSKLAKLLRARKATGPVVNFPSRRAAAAASPYPRQIENWRLPDISLLHETEYGFTAQQEVRVRQQAKVLEQTLEEFRLDARVVEIDTGPVITMFELKLGAGIKVSQVASLANDIARALKAHAVRVVAPISGKNTVGIEVPNVEKERVRLRELMTLAGKKAMGMGLPLFLGKDAGGAVLLADLTVMPHLLIAGTTGSGKSVCLNSVILSLLMTKRPDHVKMILIDPKMVEMSQFKDVPHLMCPIVTDMLRAEKILEWAVTKMEERYELLAEARVKNVNGYNSLGTETLYDRFEPQSEQEKARIPTHLPFIVIVIDELADLMMTSAKEVENHLSRLAQKSRAVGIHIIVATQRPEAKVVTGLIKSNLPARICFRVASRMDSRIVLDQNGGEVLMGQGDMLFLPPGSHKLIRAQGTFLEDAESQAVLTDLSERAKPEFHPELIRLRTPDASAGASLRDPLFDDAVKIVLESKRGSVSLLQRRLTIGYSRASRLVDQMAEAGIVGDYKGSQAREVMLTLDEWQSIRSGMAADAEAGYAADEEEPPDGPEKAYAAVGEADEGEEYEEDEQEA